MHDVLAQATDTHITFNREAYDRYIAEETEDKIVIAYTTMWGSTDVLAREIADGAAETGVDNVRIEIEGERLRCGAGARLKSVANEARRARPRPARAS